MLLPHCGSYFLVSSHIAPDGNQWQESVKRQCVVSPPLIPSDNNSFRRKPNYCSSPHVPSSVPYLVVWTDAMGKQSLMDAHGNPAVFLLLWQWHAEGTERLLNITYNGQVHELPITVFRSLHTFFSYLCKKNIYKEAFGIAITHLIPNKTCSSNKF